MSLIYGFNYEYKDNQSEYVLVFLHGWGCNMNYWNQIIEALGGNYSYIKFDLYGFGNSQLSQSYYDTYEYAYRIFVVLKELNFQKIILVGHSFGGRLAILLSSVFSLSIEHTILTASAGINRPSLKRWLKIRLYKLCKVLVRLRIVGKRTLNKFGSTDYKNANPLLKSVLSRVVVQDLRFVLGMIYPSIVMYWGSKDRDTPSWICNVIKRGLRVPCRILAVKNKGHFVAFENYIKFAQLLLEYVTK